MSIVYRLLLLFSCICRATVHSVLCQPSIAVIADTQSPIWIEYLWSEGERNVEATDTLFARLQRERISALFMLGDLVAIGSYSPHWARIDHFLDKMRHEHIPVYALPGNHEYSIPAAPGIYKFHQRFPGMRKLIEVHTVDSVAMVLLDSNYSHISREDKERQVSRYAFSMDSLQHCPAVRAIIVCAHQSPYTNSSGVKADASVQERLVPLYLNTPKAVLFLSGHSHNLERFRKQGKEFLVTGGGGGLLQPLLPPEKRKYTDLIPPNEKLRFFYVLINREKDVLHVKIKGMDTGDFSIHTGRHILSLPLM